ncbi:hypothetical protein Plec18170_005388 [Paecilomyces lecythidis]
MSTNYQYSALNYPKDSNNNDHASQSQTTDVNTQATTVGDLQEPPVPENSTGRCSSSSSEDNTRRSTEFDLPRQSETIEEQGGATSELRKATSPGAKRTLKNIDWAGSWAWEIGGSILSVICIALLIGFLAYVNGMAYGSWQYTVSPNAVVSVITAFAKAAMLIPVSSCLGQLKWGQRGHQKPMRLYHFYVLDQASRGPYGALEVFWTIGSALAILGSLLTVLSVAIDPFTQQILSFPTREVHELNLTASAQKAQVYAPAWADNDLELYELEPTMQTAILTGLARINTPLEAICPTAHCDYPDFVTLGICTQCEDITEKTVQTCQPLSNTSAGWEWFSSRPDYQKIPADCSYKTPNGFVFTPELMIALPHKDELMIERQPFTSIATSSQSTPDLGLLVSFFSAKYPGNIYYSHNNVSAVESKPIMTECSVHLCEKEYTQNNISTNSRGLQPSRTKPLAHYTMDPNDKSLLILQPENGTETLSKNSTYRINMMSWQSFTYTMRMFFNVTFVQGNPYTDPGNSYPTLPGVQSAPILFNSDNITDSLARMGEGMTDNIRSSNKGALVNGRAFLTETYVHVRWPWTTLPIALVALAIVHFVATAINSRGQSVLWKSSMFPFLMGQLKTLPEHDIANLRHMDKVYSMSRKIKVVVEDHEDGQLLFSER